MVSDHSDSQSRRKEGNVLFNDALDTFYFTEGRKERFYLMTHSTHFIYGRKERFYLTTHSTHFILRKEGKVLFNDALNTFYFTEGRKGFI